MRVLSTWPVGSAVEPSPVRTVWFFLALGLVAGSGLAATEPPSLNGHEGVVALVGSAARGAVVVAALTLGLVVNPRAWVKSVLGAAACGAWLFWVVGTYLAAESDGGGQLGRVACAVLGWAIGLPFLQELVGRQAHARGDAPAVGDWGSGWRHYAAFDAFAAGTALAAAGASWALLSLSSTLMGGLGSPTLASAAQSGWCTDLCLGAGAGLGLGLARTRASGATTLLALLQSVSEWLALPLAALLAAVNAIGYLNLGSLAQAPALLTPALLGAALVAVMTVDLALGDFLEISPATRFKRAATTALALEVLPLAVLAALTLRAQVERWGFSPDRLWQTCAVGTLLIAGFGHLTAVVFGGEQRALALRKRLLGLLASSALLSLVLSTPVVDFEAVSAGSQVQRLVQGQDPSTFDFQALRSDLGPVGRQLLSDLTRHPNVEIRRRARAALEAAPAQRAAAWTEAELDARLLIVGSATSLPPALRSRLREPDGCGGGFCALVLDGPGGAWVVRSACDACPLEATRWSLGGEAWAPASDAPGPQSPETRARLLEALRAGRVQVRGVQRRQLFIDGQATGWPQ